MSDILDSVIEHASVGIPVFPLKEGEKRPVFPGSFKDATSDIKQIEMWWKVGTKSRANYNFGIPTGVVFDILDVDFGAPKNEFDRDSLKHGADPKSLSKLEPTSGSRTCGGGYHLAYAVTPGLRNGKIVERGIQVKTIGAYIVGPGSYVYEKLESGVVYRDGYYTAGVEPWGTSGLVSMKFSQMPQWIIDSPGLKQRQGDRVPVNGRHDMVRDWIYRYVADFREEPRERVFEAAMRFISVSCESPRDFDSEQRREEVWRMVDGAIEKVRSLAPIRLYSNKECKEILENQMTTKLNSFIKIFHDGNRIDHLPIKNLQKKEVELITNLKSIRRTINKKMAEINGEPISRRELEATMHFYEMELPSIEEPVAPFCFLSENKWCYKKLDFDPSPGEYPAWSSFLDRLSNKEEFMAFVWSIFELEDEGRQFCYLYGKDGQEGKSTVINVLSEILDSASYAISGMSVKSADSLRWLNAGLVDKRFVSWADCKQPWFCSSEVLRNMTSGDYVECERKGQDPFKAKIKVKLMIASNSEPQIGDEGADTSRLIRIDVAPVTGDFYPNFYRSLKEELPFFLYDCKQMYKILCPDKQKILLSEKTKELVQQSTLLEASKYDEFLELVDIGPGLQMTSGDFLSTCRSVGMLSNQDIGRLKVFLKEKMGVQFRRVGGHDHHARERMMVGMRRRESRVI